MDDPTTLAAQDAAEALIALGWPIRPYDDDMGHWRIGELIMTDEELIGLATRRGIRPPGGRRLYPLRASDANHAKVFFHQRICQSPI